MTIKVRANHVELSPAHFATRCDVGAHRANATEKSVIRQACYGAFKVSAPSPRFTMVR